MTTHDYAKSERDAANNHGACWVAQVAQFTQLTGNRELQAWRRNRFKTVLLPAQMAPDVGFPLELQRTKPYGYSLFNLDVLSIVAQSLSNREDNLWTFALPEGRGMAKAVAYMYPFIADKKRKRARFVGIFGTYRIPLREQGPRISIAQHRGRYYFRSDRLKHVLKYRRGPA
jgi:hypothetical protein